ncbi:hypothetical protein HX857_28695 [Pseudomonas gingeri]|uniref:DUF6124 family protein n=1 Tax=Pseudomonas gingeri TaxID=117681 RepID=UPI0015A1635F|nr:hypothetical protein [Pseudomonas gingeri]NWE46857.1 hypothetical protein [Pseudomonas gingeri]NWE72692.1 hypothetical protein [Pseudomonas gingeri]
MAKKITPDPPPCRTSSLSEKSDCLCGVLEQINADPPPCLLLDTLTTAFNTAPPDCAHRSALFSVQPGITATVALAHVSDLLKVAELNADEIGPHLHGVDRDLFRGVMHALELSRTVVDSLLAGVNPQLSS